VNFIELTLAESEVIRLAIMVEMEIESRERVLRNYNREHEIDTNDKIKELKAILEYFKTRLELDPNKALHDGLRPRA
jgi:hypothetical protein